MQNDASSCRDGRVDRGEWSEHLAAPSSGRRRATAPRRDPRLQSAKHLRVLLCWLRLGHAYGDVELEWWETENDAFTEWRQTCKPCGWIRVLANFEEAPA
jgi:hypothetical protein